MLSALLNSASRCTVAESSDASDEMRKSRRIWLTRSGETIRRCDDCPTSVLKVSATLDPSQPRLWSAEALRKGRMASDTAGAAGAVFVLLGEDNFPRSRKPASASTKTAAVPPIQCQGTVCPQGFSLVGKRNVAPARLPCQASKSRKNSVAFW